MPAQTRQWILNKKPVGFPVLTGDDATFKLTTAPLPAPSPSQVILKTSWLSNDPAQRTWIDPTADPARMYMPPVAEGEPMGSFALSYVIESGNPDRLPVGALVLAKSGWCQYSVQEISDCQVITPLPGVSLGHFLGSFGFNGLTAYYGITQVVKATAEDTVVVSGAAGATGSMVVQIAKKLIGCRRVIGIAGTDEKCRWVEKLGADVCVNYKKPSFEEDLVRATEGGVEVFFDNVGGHILDAMLKCMKLHGRIAVCGAISAYNNKGEPVALKNFFEIVSNRISIKGLIVIDYFHKTAEVIGTLVQAWMDGKLIVDDTSLTAVEAKFDEIPHVWMKLFDGSHTGKLATKLID